MARDWLINFRVIADFSQEEVATKAEISRQYYGMIENGERNPSVEVAKKIGSALGFVWTLFFEQQGNKTFPDSEQAAAKEVG